jgi:hypothetical protein
MARKMVVTTTSRRGGLLRRMLLGMSIGGVVGVVLLVGVPSAYSGDLRDISEYPGLRDALNKAGLTDVGTILITRVGAKGAEKVGIFDPEVAEVVTAGTDAVAQLNGLVKFWVEADVATMTLSASPDCTLQKIGGSLVWVPKGCHN